MTKRCSFLLDMAMGMIVTFVVMFLVWLVVRDIQESAPLPNSLMVRVLNQDNEPMWAKVWICKDSDSKPFEVAYTHMDGLCEFRNVPYKSVVIRAECGGLYGACWYTPHGGAEFAATIHLMRGVRDVR